MAYTINYNPFDSYDSLYTNTNKSGIYNPDAYPLLLKSVEHKYFNPKNFLSKFSNKEEESDKKDNSSFFESISLEEAVPDSSGSKTEEIRAEYVSPSEIENMKSSEPTEETNNSPYPLNWSFTQVLDTEGVKYKITSHRRAKKVGKAKNSWHGTLYAWDIVPAGGVSWDQFKRLIYGNSKIISWLRQKRNINGMQRSYGIIDETRDDIRKKTGGTGPHLHIGPDTYGVAMLEDYIKNPRLWGGTTKHINGGILIKKYANGDEIYYNNMYGKPFEPVFVSESDLANYTPKLPSLSILNTNSAESSPIQSSSPILNYGSSSNNNSSFFSYSGETAPKSNITVNDSSTVYIPGPDGNPIPIPKEYIPKGFSEEDMRRGISVAYYLISKGGFSKEQAAALIGVFLDENHCNPKNYMREERRGNGSLFAVGKNKYGAGIGSWTGTTKFNYLTTSGYSKDTKVEDLPLDKQCWLIINAANKENVMKPFYDMLKSTKTLEEAMPAAYLITAGVGSRWGRLPTVLDALKRDKTYERSNNARYGNSPYHGGTYNRRYNYAKQFLNLINYLQELYRK